MKPTFYNNKKEGVMFIIVTLLGLHHRVASAVPITVNTESSGTRLQSDDIGNDSQGDKDNQLSTCGFVDGQPNLVNMSLSLATTTIAQQAAGVRREIASVLKKIMSQSPVLAKRAGIRKNITGMDFSSQGSTGPLSQERIVSDLRDDLQHVHQIAKNITTELVVPLATYDQALSSQVSEIQARVLSLDCTIQICLVGQGTSPHIPYIDTQFSRPQGCSSESMCLMKTFAVLSDVSQYMNTIQTVYGSVTVPRSTQGQTSASGTKHLSSHILNLADNI